MTHIRGVRARTCMINKYEQRGEWSSRQYIYSKLDPWKSRHEAATYSLLSHNLIDYGQSNRKKNNNSDRSVKQSSFGSMQRRIQYAGTHINLHIFGLLCVSWSCLHLMTRWREHTYAYVHSCTTPQTYSHSYLLKNDWWEREISVIFLLGGFDVDLGILEQKNKGCYT